jgi:hypothetical protein
MALIPGGLASIFGPGAKFVMPQNSFNPTPAPTTPTDGRSYYTGQITQTGYGDAGDPNAGRVGGAAMAPWQDPNGGVPYGGYSQFVGVPNGSYSGYQTPNFVPQPYEGNDKPPAWLHPGNIPAPHAAEPPAPQTPKPAEPPSWMQPMMGQWGGGAYNVGSGAPASMQQMWLGSMNGGKSWAQAPSYNASAPQPGQASRGSWSQAPSQDPDSPTWVQGGR